MRNNDYIFSDNGDIKVIRLSQPEQKGIEIVEIGYGRAKNSRRYVLMRDYYILQFITSGRGRFCGEEFGAGDMIVIRPGQLEIREPDPNAPYECAWIMIYGHTASELLQSVYPKDGSCVVKFDRATESKAKIKSLVDNLWQDKSISVEYSMLSVFYSLLSFFPAPKNDSRPDPVSLALAYIKINYKNEDLRISDISSFSGVTQNHLCKLFKKATGKSIMETLLDVRLSEAAVLLQNTDISVGEIAYSVGFSDPKHFSQMFKKKYQSTPGNYRSK